MKWNVFVDGDMVKERFLLFLLIFACCFYVTIVFCNLLILPHHNVELKTNPPTNDMNNIQHGYGCGPSAPEVNDPS